MKSDQGKATPSWTLNRANLPHWAASFFAPSADKNKKQEELIRFEVVIKAGSALKKKRRGFLLSLLGVDVTVSYRVDGIMAPEENPAVKNKYESG